MKKDIVKALPIKEWGVVGEPFEYQEERGRIALTIGIGTRQDANTITYITEPIYQDIINEIISEESNYKVDVDVYATPPIVVTNNNKLIIHSEPVKKLKMQVQFVLKDIPVDLKVKAIRDIRLNQDAKSKLGESIKAIRSIIKDTTEYNLNFKFIECLLKEEYIDKLGTPENNELDKRIYKFSKQQLIAAMAGLAEIKLKRTTTIEPLASLLKEIEAPTGAIEKALKDVIALHFFMGNIK